MVEAEGQMHGGGCWEGGVSFAHLRSFTVYSPATPRIANEHRHTVASPDKPTNWVTHAGYTRGPKAGLLVLYCIVR